MKVNRRVLLVSLGCAPLTAALLPTRVFAGRRQKPEKRLGLLLDFPTPEPGQGIDATIPVGKLFSYTVEAAGGGVYLVSGIVQPQDKNNRYALELNVYAVQADKVKVLLKPAEAILLTKHRRETLRAEDGKELWVTLSVAEGKGT